MSKTPENNKDVEAEKEKAAKKTADLLAAKKLAAAKVSLSQLKKDENAINQKIDELINAGYEKSDAKLQADYEEILNVAQKRKTILKDNPEVKASKDLLKNVDIVIKKYKKEISDLKVKHDKEKTKKDPETMTEEKYIEEVESIYKSAIANHFADDIKFSNTAIKLLPSFIEEIKEEFNNKSPDEQKEALSEFKKLCEDKEELMDAINKSIEEKGEEEEPERTLEINEPGVGSAKIIEELENEIADITKLINDTDFSNDPDKKEEFEKQLEDSSKDLMTAKEINQDRLEKPFLYYSLEKSNNKILLSRFKTGVHELLDLKGIEKDTGTNREFTQLQETGENEGFFQFNIYGQICIIKNVKELRGDKGINASSEEAIYKIVGQDGEILADNIIGYTKCQEIYSEKARDYGEKIKKEFEGNPESNREMPGLNSLKLEIQQDINDIRNGCVETVVENGKIILFEDMIGNLEKERADQLENGPLSSRMKKGIMDGLSSWENYGQGEKGWRGFAKRTTKMAVNLALIGAISSISIDQLAKQTTMISTTALGAGVTSNIGRKLAFGLGIGSFVDLAGSKMPDKVKKYMPHILAVGGVVAATVLSGAIAVGAVAGASAFLGYHVSKHLKGQFTNEKINERKAEATEKLLKKYEGTTGQIDLSRISLFEKEYKNLLIKYENQGIWGKSLDEVAKIIVGSAVSTTAMAASGYARDNFVNNSPVSTETTNESGEAPVVNNSEEKAAEIESQDEESTEDKKPTDGISKEQQRINDEALLKEQEDQLKAEEAAALEKEQAELKIKQEAEQIKTAIVGKGGSYERSFIHQIEADPKLAQDLGYEGDPGDKSALHEFAGRQAHLIAINTGIVGGDGEQLGITEADKIAPIIIIENGQVTIEEKTIDGEIITTHSEGDKYGENMSKFNYPINNSSSETLENSQTDPTEHGGNNTDENTLLDRQVNPVTGEPINNSPAVNPEYSQKDPTENAGNNNPEDNTLLDRQVNPVTGEPMSGSEDEKAESGNSSDLKNVDNNSNTINENPSSEQLNLAHELHQENINHFFHDNEENHLWDNIKNSKFDDYIEMMDNLPNDGSPTSDTYIEYTNYLEKLGTITGFEPIYDDFPQIGETIKEYQIRCEEEVARLGRLEEIKY